MLPYIDPAILSLLKVPGNRGLFFNLDTSPPAKFWTGTSPVRAGITSVDPFGNRYLGGGGLIELPEFDALINGQAERLEVFISGVPIGYTEAFFTTMPVVANKTCRIGFAPLDKRWQPLSPIIPLMTARTDFWAIRQDPASEEDPGPVCTIILSMSSGDTARANPQLVSWTADQQRSIPGSEDDAFCDRTSRYDQSYDFIWPRFK